MLNRSTQPLARSATSSLHGRTLRQTTSQLRAPAQALRRVEAHRSVKPAHSTGYQELPPVSVARRLAAGPTAAARIGSLDTRVIDGMPTLLYESYRLRHQVYCVERGFLPAADYREPIEFDRFDACSVHVAVTDPQGTLAGTGRLILPVEGTLPTLEYCSFPATGDGPLWGAKARWVEVSRLSVSRSYGAAVRAADGTRQPGTGDRAHVFLAILEALYQGSRRLDATHLLVSIERSLQRMLVRAGFPFRQLGPGFDYFGAVAAYSMDVREFEDVVASGRYPDLADFVAGLPPLPRLAAPAIARAGAAAAQLDQLSLAG